MDVVAAALSVKLVMAVSTDTWHSADSHCSRIRFGAYSFFCSKKANFYIVLKLPVKNLLAEV